MEKGIVHSIESFGAVDGPGIRTVVFLQGCPNRCQYCHNVDVAIKEGGKEYSVEQLVTEIMKNKEYWKSYSDGDNSVKGGVTFSGGEPLLQHKFLLETIKALKKLGVHTVIDTSAKEDFKEIQKLATAVDMWMISIKHMDDKVHQKLVGNSNVEILENIKQLDEIYFKKGQKRKIRVRFVIIPTITDSKEHLEKLGKFISKIKTLEKVELLPYSTIGKSKWYEIFGQYHLEGIREANSKDVEKAKKILSKYASEFI